MDANERSAIQIRLSLFAFEVLDILESHEDWDSSTLQEIANAAIAHQLGDNENRDNMFKARI